MVISQKAKKYFQQISSCIAYHVGNKIGYNYVVGARFIEPAIPGRINPTPTLLFCLLFELEP